MAGSMGITKSEATAAVRARYHAQEQLIVLSRNLLMRLDSITTEDFSKGAERAEREALRSVLIELGAIVA